MEQVRDSVVSTLKNTTELELSLILTKLQECGCESLDDCQFITEDDLCPPLKPVKCRKLLQVWKFDGSNVTERMPVVLREVQPSQPNSSRMIRANFQSSAAVHSDNDWAQKFVVPWDNVAPSVIAAVKAKKRLSPPQKTAFVKSIVDEMRKKCPNPGMAETRIIAKQIVGECRNSFEDRTDDGETLGDGSYSLAKKIKTRIEYTNRGNMAARLRQLKKSKQSGENSNEVTTRTSGTQYGCVAWQPLGLPENETEESLNAKKLSLQQLAVQGPAAAQKAVHRIDTDMVATYVIQRRIINSNPPVAIEVIQSQWPFLFYDRWLFRHFEQLVGKPPYSTLLEALAVKGPRIMSYFACHGDPTEKGILQAHHELAVEDTDDVHGNAVAATVLHLMMHHFREQEDSLVKLADVTVAVIDVESWDLPDSPRLIVLGESLASVEQWLISVEKRVVYVAQEVECRTLMTGLAALFAVYFVFNLKYQPEAEGTLEFIQRCLMKINPTKGTKRQAGKRFNKGKQVACKIEPLHPRVLAFVNQLADFEWTN